METRVTTGKVRFSYLQVFQAKAMEEGETPKYSTAILVSKKDKATIAKIDAAIEAAKRDGKTKKWGGKIPPSLKIPWRDGDDEKPDDEAYKGHLFFNASSVRKPIVLGPDKRPLEDESELYSGAYGRAVLNFYPFAGKSKGIAVGLESILKLEDGESLGGGTVTLQDAIDAFSDEDDLM
jgi:hypothetical protein